MKIILPSQSQFNLPLAQIRGGIWWLWVPNMVIPAYSVWAESKILWWRWWRFRSLRYNMRESKRTRMPLHLNDNSSKVNESFMPSWIFWQYLTHMHAKDREEISLLNGTMVRDNGMLTWHTTVSFSLWSFFFDCMTLRSDISSRPFASLWARYWQSIPERFIILR